MKNPVGIMQGRLLPPVGNRFQAFPEERWEEEFPIASELGLDCIEFIFEGGDYLRHPLINHKGLNRIRQLIDETGVMVNSVCADYFMEYPMHKGSSADRGKSISVLKLLIESCSTLGVRDIVIPCVDQSKLATKDETRIFVESLNQCLATCIKYGINLCLETDLPPADFLSLLKSFDSGFIKANYDIGNSASLGYNPEEELDAYGSWITDVHIKDRRRNGGTVPLGAGDADFDTVFKKLKEKGFEGIYILQTARKEAGAEVETIKEYLDFVKPFLK